MNTQETHQAHPTEAQSRHRVVLLQCGKSSCGYVLTENEQAWVPHPEFSNSTIATCPKCGNEDFYTLNTLGQKRKSRDESPREITLKDIHPSPKMGLKMKRRILAAKRRALTANP